MPLLIFNKYRNFKNVVPVIAHLTRQILRVLGLSKYGVAIYLEKDKTMKQVNFVCRGIKKTTDIISIPTIVRKISES
jgi:ssRNA-specific RNase YbeY (16S rRNA maturation enzyme)